MLLVPVASSEPAVVKDYSACSGPVRWLLAPLRVRHELAMLRRVQGLPGVPEAYGRVDRLALAMQFIDGVPLRRRFHHGALPAAFFDALHGILDGLSLRGVIYLDLRSPTNVLCVRGTDAPALVDLASAICLPLPRRWTRRLDHSALAKLRARFEGGGDAVEPPSPAGQELRLGRARLWIVDGGRNDDPVPALLLHDVGHSSAVFGPMLERASAHGRRALALDLPGFGASRLRLSSLTPLGVAKRVHRLLDALRLSRVDLVGFGWGGLIGRVLAARWPDRVRCLITLDTPLDRLEGGFQRRWQEARRGPEVLRRRLLCELPPGLAGPARAELVSAIQRADPRALVRAFSGLRVRRRGSGPEPRLELRGLPLPPQPWLVLRSEPPEETAAAAAVGLPQPEWWSQPLAEPDRFWTALAALAQRQPR